MVVAVVAAVAVAVVVVAAAVVVVAVVVDSFRMERTERVPLRYRGGRLLLYEEESVSLSLLYIDSFSMKSRERVPLLYKEEADSYYMKKREFLASL